MAMMVVFAGIGLSFVHIANVEVGELARQAANNALICASIVSVVIYIATLVANSDANTE